MTRVIGGFRRLFRQSLIMKSPRFFRIKTDIKLIFPTKLKPRFGHGIITRLRSGVSFG
jgi:hypothetical protein